ncbi:MAG: Hsp20/alpha crystallin family protein [Patescibacteria group bacterium]
MARSEIEKFFSDDDNFFSRRNTQLLTGDEWDTDTTELEEGQLSIDMIETNSDIIVKAPIAGVKKDDVEVAVTEDMITIRGKREHEFEKNNDDFHIQECYWGAFSRSQSFPTSVLADKAEAVLKDGVLTVRVPKSSKAPKGKLLKIKTD